MQTKNAMRQILFALGFLSIATQVYMVRESMMVLGDNEMIIGLVLAAWMLITGVGASLGRFRFFGHGGEVRLVFLLMLQGILPVLMVTSLALLKSALVPFGSMADLLHVIVISVLAQLPFCLLNGFLFSWLSRYSPGTGLSEAYAWESLGSMASGAMVNFVFLWISGPFQSLLIITGVYFLLVVGFARITLEKKQVWVVLAASLAIITIIGVTNFRTFTSRSLYPGQQVVSDTETPYGQVVITKTSAQLNYFENGTLLFSSGNAMSNEENVHYAMVQRPHPASVLLVSGGFSGTLGEILKYRPKCVDYVELNPSLIGIARRFTRQVGDPSVNVCEMDARKFIRTTKNSYDVVLVNLPPPSSLQLNRYYSVEFIQEVRRKMGPDAVISFNLPASADYVSGQAGALNAVLYHTLKQSFKYVMIIPAGRTYFLASDAELALDIPRLIDVRGINTLYVNKYYLDKDQLQERSEYVTASSTGPAPVNHDFKPVAVWRQMSWWLSHFSTSHVVILLVFGVIMLGMILTLNPVSAGLFAGGFTLASTEIILIFGLQVLTGYIFQAVGAIIMIFMLGLAAGAGVRFRLYQRARFRFYRTLQLLLGLLALLIPVLMYWVSAAGMSNWLIHVIFALSAFMAAFLAGMEYHAAVLLSAATKQQTVARNYSAEMFGSAAGAFAVTLLLIPSIGIIYTGMVLALLNLASFCASFLPHKRGQAS